MNAPHSHPARQSADRQVLYAMILVGVLAFIMVTCETLDRLEVQSVVLKLYGDLEIGFEIMIVAAIAWAGPLALGEMKRRRLATRHALEAGTQVEVLFQMTDILQSALGYADANAVLRATAGKLLPGLGGALYVFNNSGDRLELSAAGRGRMRARRSPFSRPPNAGRSSAGNRI